MARREAHPPLLADRGEEQDPFHPGKLFANADPCASAEGEEGEFRATRLCLRRPTLRIKAQWVRVVARVAVHDELAHEHNRVGRH